MFIKLIKSMEKFGASGDDILHQFLKIEKDEIKENVIIAPWWEPGIFNLFKDSCEKLNNSDFIKAWDVKADSKRFTYIKTGIGAPVLADVVLSLGLTHCKKIIFIGSAGGLEKKMNIGDLVVSEYSVCGDGFSRYLVDGKLKNSDLFGEKAYPDPELSEKLKDVTKRICLENKIGFHTGRVFSTDTIFAQFMRIDEIIELGCNAVEMETAAAFRAAVIAGISIAALLSVSDNVVNMKSLLSGRTKEEKDYRKEVRKTIFPKILLEIL